MMTAQALLTHAPTHPLKYIFILHPPLPPPNNPPHLPPSRVSLSGIDPFLPTSKLSFLKSQGKKRAFKKIRPVASMRLIYI